jgi:hypothetical protein
MNSIGKGSFSKVKRVIRKSQQKTEDEDEDIAEFAMKIMHKPTLRRERAIRYSLSGEM